MRTSLLSDRAWSALVTADVAINQFEFFKVDWFRRCLIGFLADLGEHIQGELFPTKFRSLVGHDVENVLIAQRSEVRHDADLLTNVLAPLTLWIAVWLTRGATPMFDEAGLVEWVRERLFRFTVPQWPTDATLILARTIRTVARCAVEVVQPFTDGFR